MEDSTPRARIRRAVALIGVSVITIAGTGVVWLHPSMPALGAGAMQNPAAPSAAYHIVAVDFVDPADGWVVANFDSGDYALLHTADGGRSWTEQLATPAHSRVQYLKFFDRAVGVVALRTPRSALYRTGDGGRTWTSLAAPKTGSVLSWSFVDSDHGWALVEVGTRLPTLLYRTEDGGHTWIDLGPPVPAPDRAFTVQFSYLTTGWLATASSGAYAYKSNDFGATWSRVALPVTGIPQPSGRFFVDVQRTSGKGAIASVVGRSGNSGTIRAFPPLTAPFYDGSRPSYYVFTTAIDQIVGGTFGVGQAPVEELLSSLDNGNSWVPIEPPSTSGVLGYFDASRWWWVGSGRWSISDDGGATWTGPRVVGVVEPQPGSLQVVDRDDAWFASAGGPMLETTYDGGAHWRLVRLPPLTDLPAP
jgi:photosystem II stability/assembly factor-like uncharacterized protein